MVLIMLLLVISGWVLEMFFCRCLGAQVLSWLGDKKDPPVNCQAFHYALT